MKYPGYTYAKALAEVISGAASMSEKEKDAIAKNFIDLVRKNGDEPHLRKIVEEAARLTRGKRGVRKVTVASARELSAAQEKALKPFMKESDVVERSIDPELVAGVKLVIDDELQYDGSLRGKLDKLFGIS